MATQTTGGGSTTSFTNTPQANGDTFLKGEDQTGVFLLDVMANDLGGNAKVLWSLDDGSGSTSDLLVTDIGEVAATTDDHSAHGAKIWICNGKVAYDATTLDAAFKASLQALAVGESATDTFTYAIRLANGTLAWTTATVVYSGSNDAPVISVGSSDSAGDTLDETNSGLSTSGTLTVVDPDTSDVVDTSVTGVVLSGDTGTLANGDVIGMLSIVDGTDNDLQANSGDANNLHWAFNSGAVAFDYLADGEALTLTYTLTSSDGHGGSDTQTVTITIEGTNDGPAIVAGGDLDGAIEEESGVYMDSGSFGFTDVDASDVHSVGATPGGLGYLGTFTPSVSDDSTGDGSGTIGWNFSVANADLQFLAEGETRTQTYTVTVDDGHGGTASETVTVVLTGDNDPVVVTVGASDSAGDTLAETNSGLSTSGSLTVTDVDTSDVVDTAVTNLAIAGNQGTLLQADLEAMLSFTGGTENNLAANTGDSNNLAWSFDSGSEAFNYLAAGESLTLTYTLTSGDGHGSTDTQDVTIVINGTNDAPVITVGAGDSAGDILAETNSGLSTSGSLTVTDLDTSDVVDTTVTNLAISGNQGALLQGDLEAMLGFTGGTENNLAANAGAANNLAWSFDSGSEAFNYLAAGDSLTLTYTLTSSDGHGGTDTQDVTIVINGTNDAPVITSNSGGATASVSIDENTTAVTTVTATDVDSPTITYSIVGGADSAKFTIDPNTGVLSFVNAPDFENPTDVAGGSSVAGNNVYDVVVQASDGSLVDTQAIAVTVTDVNAAPVITSNSGGASASVNVAENTTAVTTVVATDDGENNNTLTYSIVGGADSAKFTIDPNTGVLSFVNAPNFENPTDVAGGSSVAGNNVYDVVVQASDGSLVDTQAIAVTVTDVNAAPVITSNSGGASASVNVAENTTAVTTVVATDDGENNNTLTYSIVGGADSAKFTIDPNTGALSFVNAPDFENPTDVAGGSSVAGNNVYDVVVQASDGSLVDTQAIAVTVTDAVERIAPTDIKLTPQTPADNVNFQTFTFNGTLTATDPDPGAISFAIQSQTGGGNFAITGGSVLTSTDIVQNSTYSVTIRATQTGDPAGTFLDETFTVITGGNGNNNDTLNGVGGDDVLYGNTGNDMIFGMAGNDSLFGQDGNDRLEGGSGSDTLSGGIGTDTFVLTDATAVDTISDYAAGEIIDVTSILSVTTATNVVTGGYMRLTTTGLLQVDLDGGGNNWVTVANVNLGVNTTVRYDLSDGTTQTVVLTPVAPPIALDLNGDGVISFIGTDAGASFDYGGGKVATAWVGPQDGILVRDANHDGLVSADEIVFATDGSDLEGLARYDSNADGQLSAADANFAEFGVWQDADSDGQVDAGELQSLTAEGIASISLSSDGVGYSAAGGDVSVVGTGSFTRTDGSTGVLADAVFATGDRVAEAELRTAAVSANSNVIAAAVAAMGFAATAAAAHEPSMQGNHGQQGEQESLPSQSIVADQVADISAGPVQLEALDGGVSQAASSAALHTSASASPAESNLSLTGSDTSAPAELAPLAAGTEAQGSDASGPAIAPAMVAMPSAEALVAAFDDATAAKAAAGETAASVVAEALADGNQGSAIDAILAATLPSNANNGQVDAAQAAFAAFAGHAGPAAAEWHGSGFGFGMGNALGVEHVALHPDMPAPV